MDVAGEIETLKAAVARQAEELAEARHRIGLLEDKNEIERLQYLYGFLIDNRMFQSDNKGGGGIAQVTEG